MGIKTNEYFRIGEFARVARITRQRLHRLHQEGKGPPREYVFERDAQGRVPKRGVPRIPREECLRWLAERKRAA